MIPGTRGTTGQLAVLQEVPPPTAPRLGGFALSDLGQLYITEVVPAGFDPSQLDLAWWYDFSDLTTLFQDTAGTVPVTADGQAVELIVDKGPFGINLVATGTGGIYRTDGTSHWIETTDGATYSQTIPQVFNALTMFIGYSIDSTDLNGGMWYGNEPEAQYVTAMENGADVNLTTWYGFPITAEYIDGVSAPGLTRGGLYNASVDNPIVYSCDFSTLSPATNLFNGWTGYQIEGRVYSMLAALNLDAAARDAANQWVTGQLPPNATVFIPPSDYSVTNGFLFDIDGRLCCTVTGPIVYWAGGLPFSEFSELVLTDLLPDANTSYVGGIAVRPEGVCATGAAPLVEGGFSPGYSGGFDATVDS